jgi:hypothetical protein
MEKYEDRAECLQAIKALLNCIQTQIDPKYRKEAIFEVLPLLKALLAAAERGKDEMLDSGTCLFLLLSLMDEEQYDRFISSFPSQEELKVRR